MIETNKVVAHLLDGTRFKGTTRDFFPNRPIFRIEPAEGGPAAAVAVSDLKALFFVHDLKGDKTYQKARGFQSQKPTAPQGKRIAIHFKDGELLCGYSLAYTPDRGSFFLLPADSGGNNQRVYVVAGSAEQICVGPAADALVLQVFGKPS